MKLYLMVKLWVNYTIMVKKEKIIKTALIIVGNVLEPFDYQLSKVYDSEFTHGYRKGIRVEKQE